MRIITATTLTNPNDNVDKFIMVKLHQTEQKVKAVFVNPITLDHREQKPNIKIGSEVAVIFDEHLQVFYVIGTIQQGIELVKEKIYKVENSDEVQILTDKKLTIESIGGEKIKETTLQSETVEVLLNTIKIQNQTAELIATLSDLVQANIDEQHIGNLGVPTALHPASSSAYSDIKAKIDSFKM